MLGLEGFCCRFIWYSNTPEVGLPQRQPERLHQPRAANNGATLSALSLSATATVPPSAPPA